MNDELNPAALPDRFDQLVDELSCLYKENKSRSTRLEQAEQELRITKERNEELEKRVKDLEREVGVWRLALEREEAAKEAMVKTTHGLARELTSIREDAPLIVCLIDGDGTVFSQKYLVSGQYGGRQAAQTLHRNLLESIDAEPARTHAVVCATVFCNRRGLRDTLLRAGICSAQQFSDFWVGFTQAVNMFQMVDVGPGKEAADAKLREALRVYTRMPQVMRVFFGGAHDNGYRPPLSALALDGSIDKVVLIQAHHEVAHELRTLNLENVRWDGLFMPHKLVVQTASGSGSGLQDLPSSPSTPRVAPGPPKTDGKPELPPGMRYVDNKMSLGKQKPPPCNFHYLSANCVQGAKCQYAHNFVLTPGQIAALRKMAKTTPCHIANRNQKCPLGDKCCMSHRCPNASDCALTKAGKCKWTGKNMHDPPSQSA
ncbi:hypothetical protein EXIGLDRAFT_724636 [Exidia glandulosa HHB12029]|uniref:C3H1-type domain-containing protein n=1 Tax=Exidia glandulosa HHB12029 TaxID=1314781 RepID=A0A165MR19_EXIGL|nr:hypothetical protein EXIGLDRAFT_724636 [Exidia glandulosa HHB12029]